AAGWPGELPDRRGRRVEDDVPNVRWADGVRRSPPTRIGLLRRAASALLALPGLRCTVEDGPGAPGEGPSCPSLGRGGHGNTWGRMPGGLSRRRGVRGVAPRNALFPHGGRRHFDGDLDCQPPGGRPGRAPAVACRFTGRHFALEDGRGPVGGVADLEGL